MKLKANLKFVLIFCIMILAILLIASTKVQAVMCDATSYAVITSGTITESDIPDTFKVDIEEVEFEKSYDIILDQLITNLQKQNIETVKYSYEKDAYGNIVIDYEDIEKNANGKDYIQIKSFDIKKASISISGKELKEVNIVYNNSNQYDTNIKTNIEQKANKLNLPKVDNTNTYKCVKEIELSTQDAWGDWWEQYAIENLTNAFNDKTITITEGITAFGDAPDAFEDGWTKPFYVFKNGVYYTTIEAYCGFTSKITVPANVEDIEKYAITKINEYLEEFNETIYGGELETETVTKLEKISGDNYKVYLTGGGKVIIPIRKATSDNTGNKEDTNDSSIIQTDTTTNIKLETTTDVVPEDTKLIVKKVTEGENYNKVVEVLGSNVSKFILYDISLMSNNANIQPNGKVKISLPIPSGYDTNNIVIYRVADNGDKIKYNATISNNYAIIETDHFSNYVIAEEKADTTQTPATEENRELDETPKTGVNNVALVSIAIVSIISLAGIIIIKKK